MDDLIRGRNDWLNIQVRRNWRITGARCLGRGGWWRVCRHRTGGPGSQPPATISDAGVPILAQDAVRYAFRDILGELMRQSSRSAAAEATAADAREIVDASATADELDAARETIAVRQMARACAAGAFRVGRGSGGASQTCLVL